MDLSTPDSEAGRKANLNGKDFENTIELRIQQRGYTLWNGKGSEPVRWYKKQAVVGKNLIGRNHRLDFVLSSGTLIEVKWQSSQGSVDEKYLWTITNLASHGDRAIMILDGGGCRPAMEDFLRDIASRSENLTVCNLSEFYKLDI